MTTPSIEEVARKLTKAQRAYLTGERTLSSGGGMWPLRNGLYRKGLIHWLPPSLTPLGIAVKAHLTAGATHDR